MSIGMSPFRALYGYEAPSFVELAFGKSRAPKAKDWIQESQDILRVLKDNLWMAQISRRHMRTGTEWSVASRWVIWFF
jgi:hypothetical protein